jgi:addiction module HigA family antidote
MSQNGLAHAVGVPGNRIHAIVNGTRDITGDTDLRLCKFFGLSEGHFLRLQNAYDTIEANAELQPMSPRSSPTDRKRLPNANAMICPAMKIRLEPDFRVWTQYPVERVAFLVRAACAAAQRRYLLRVRRLTGPA